MIPLSPHPFARSSLASGQRRRGERRKVSIGAQSRQAKGVSLTFRAFLLRKGLGSDNRRYVNLTTLSFRHEHRANGRDPGPAFDPPRRPTGCGVLRPVVPGRRWRKRLPLSPSIPLTCSFLSSCFFGRGGAACFAGILTGGGGLFLLGTHGKWPIFMKNDH